jgi:hypothetical protein
VAKRVLLPLEEVLLCQWTQDQGAAGIAPSPGKVKNMASQLRHIRLGQGKEVPVQEVGKNWVESFKACNPGLQATWARSRDRKRLKGVNPHAVQPFYAALQGLYCQH